MFGIADAADGSSGESADILNGVNNEMPAVYQKRHLSPGGIDVLPPCAKQPRLDESHLMSRERQNGRNRFRSSSSKCSLVAARRTRFEMTRFDTRVRDGDSGSAGTRDPDSDGRQSDEESSSDGRSSVREDGYLRDIELKEARVLLYDIKHSINSYGRATANVQRTVTTSAAASTSLKLWEVERIVQKRKRNGEEPLYLIKWKDWQSRYNTWEPLRNLINCDDLLREFEDEQQKMIDLFKATTNFYPSTRDAERLLTELRCEGASVDDNNARYEGDDVYGEIRRYFKSSQMNREKQREKIKRQILRALLDELRHGQLESLQDWENEMNNIAKGKPTIQVENLVDLEGAPQDFYYIDNYLPGAGVIIPDDPPIGCECDVCEAKSTCCFVQNGQSLPYTSACRVRVEPGTPIYECNKRCTCDMNCPNRVVQRGTSTQLCIFRTDNGRGWGVKTLRAIKKGTFVAQYVGEVISSEEAEKRGKQYDVTGRTYLFDLDYNETDGQCPYTVDAAMYGNVSHFINHSCDPNLAVYAIWINCLDPNLPNLALFAIKDIKQNEELTFDYMCQTLRGNEKIQQQLRKESDVAGVVSKNKTLCKCGALECRRYLF